MKLFNLLFAVLLLLSCNTNKTQQNVPKKDSIIYRYESIPAKRTTVNKQPVVEYSELKADGFSVSVYETSETFHYLIEMKYKELTEKDTLRIPNFGIWPTVRIKKGDERPSCIIGFLDKDSVFRESKLISAAGKKLKVHVLKRYAVATYQDTLKNRH